MIKEQREYIRLSAEGNVVLMPEDSTLRTIKADLFDICSLGVGVCALEKIEVGIHVKFELTIKLCDEPLVGEGEIVYTNEVKKDDVLSFRMGIKFINVDNKKILNFLSVIQHDISMKARNKR